MARACSLALIVCLLSAQVLADGPVVPVAVQAVFLRKVLAYDRAFESRPVGRVVIVTGSEPAIRVQEAVAAFRQAGFDVASVGADQVERNLNDESLDASVLFILPSATSARLSALCTARKLLSVAEIPAPALRGFVSIALAQKSDGHVEILLHSAKAKAEGHEFAPALLALAHIVE